MIFTHPELVLKSDPVIELKWRLFAYTRIPQPGEMFDALKYDPAAPIEVDSFVIPERRFFYLYGTDHAELEEQAFLARLRGYRTYITHYSLQENTHE